ncbi:hypothetical protein TrVFT333_004677 [Trichoderma virens FT-333]|nr:hypothetical protein TrVFT333_004677 [Trichoderma virens FT-333]
MLDEKHPNLPKPSSDTNAYTLGSIGPHNIVIACLPKGRYGTTSAANVVTLMITTFPSIKIGLMVGIGGGVPPKLRLGDVVVSSPVGQYPGVVQWDLGKTTTTGKFERIGALNNPPNSLLTALTKLETEYDMTGSKIPVLLEKVKEKYPMLAQKYSKADTLQDLLFTAGYNHVHNPFMNAKGSAGEIREEPQESHGEPCLFCDKTKLVERKPRELNVHHGLIASGNEVIKHGLTREELNRELGGDVLCIETEAAGLMNNFPCLVIRGICDYCDSHKNDAWQEHAAVTAAAFAKELLDCIEPSDVDGEQLIRNVVNKENEARKQREILGWLSSLDFPLLQHDYFRRCAPHTGQDFINSWEVEKWRSMSKQTMFCQGVPGAGKTFQMAILVNNLVERFRGNDAVGIAYLYYNFKRQQDQMAEHMLASLVKQLTQNSRIFPEVLHQLHDRHYRMNTRPFIGELSDALTTLIQSFSRVFILIDALDEADDGERATLLKELFTIQGETGLNLFATSRAINNIAVAFEDKISREISPNRQDVFQFLNARMSTLPSFVTNDKALQQEIKESVESAIGGMFLLAQLYINSLAGKRSTASLKQALKDLRRASSSSSDRSSVLDEAYDKSIERIQQLKGDLPTDGLLILSWIVNARRQMKLTELQEALAIEIGASKLNEDNIPTVEHIIQACASLVIIEGDAVELVHYTAQEYLERPNNKWMQKAHEKIMNICMTYLTFSAFQEEPRRSQERLDKRIELNTFYNYSAEHWAYHTNRALDQGLEASKVVEFLEHGRTRGWWYQELLYSHSKTAIHPDFIPAQLTALHVAAFFGIHQVAAGLIEQGYGPNAKDTALRTPIWWAACRGKSRDFSGWTSLNVAAQLGNKAIFDLLIENGADIEASDKNCRTPLATAALYGHMNAVKWLVEKGANIEAKDRKKRTPLMLAIIGKHEEVVRYFIEKGAPMAATDDDKQLLISMAIHGKLKSIIDNFLLDGVCIDACMANNKHTPLTQAINEGDDDIVDWLIEKGANLDNCNGHGKTPLIAAIESGNKAIIQLLVDKGAGLDFQGNDGYTPLIFATKQNRQDIMELLISKGAKLEAKYNTSPSRRLYTFVGNVRLLNAALPAREDDIGGCTALSIAAMFGYLGATRLLLSSKANVEARDHLHRTPLMLAARFGQLEVVQLLLDSNADLEAEDKYQHTALVLAACGGSGPTIKILVDKKANVEHRGLSGRTALHNAVDKGKLDAVKVLLASNGVRVDAKDNFGRTPLSLATGRGVSWGALLGSITKSK